MYFVLHITSGISCIRIDCYYINSLYIDTTVSVCLQDQSLTASPRIDITIKSLSSFPILWLIEKLHLIQFNYFYSSGSFLQKSEIFIQKYNQFKMRTSLLCILGLTLVAMTVGSERSLFRNSRSILQSLAVDRMLKDRGFVMSVIDCVLDKAPCDKHGRHLKRKYISYINSMMF